MIIITKAKEEMASGERRKGNGEYYERHHILPKSLFPLWKDRKSNLVLLTAREHYFCHQLLTKVYPTKQMYYALWRLSNDGRRHNITSREYVQIKEKISELQKINGSNPCSEEKKKLFSKLYSGSGNPMYGRSAYNEMNDNEKEQYRKKMSESCKKIKRTEEWNNKISSSLKGKSKSELSIQKGLETKRINGTDKNFQIAGTAAHIGKHWFNNGKENILAFECPDGFSKGKIQKELDEATKAKVKLAQSNFGKGKHWFNNGNENFFGFDCPEGYVAGKLHKEYKKRQGSRKNLKESKDGN